MYTQLSHRQSIARPASEALEKLASQQTRSYHVLWTSHTSWIYRLSDVCAVDREIRPGISVYEELQQVSSDIGHATASVGTDFKFCTRVLFDYVYLGH